MGLVHGNSNVIYVNKVQTLKRTDQSAFMNNAPKKAKKQGRNEYPIIIMKATTKNTNTKSQLKQAMLSTRTAH